MKATTHRLDQDINLIEVGAATGMLWHHDGFVVAGVGEALRIPLTGANRAEGATAAQAALASLAGPDPINLPGSGPVALTAMPFDPEAPAELIVPEIVLVHGREGRRWLTTIADGNIALDTAIDRCLETSDLAPSSPQATRLELTSPVAPEAWRDEIVAEARDRIRSGELTKAVLARELRLRADAPLDQRSILKRLASVHRSAVIFALEGFVAASPELLVARTVDVVRAHPLAGTAARGPDQAADQQMAAALLASNKDRWEHQITINWLLDELLPFCSYVDAEPEPTIVSLPNVHHLGTKVEGRLSAPAASVLELVAALHPTPAVGGDPQDEAIRLIAEIERTERGRYAGPAGWVDAQGNGAFCVAIRSAQLDGETASFFAGVGVVADSDPEAELAETRAKFQAMLPILSRL